MTEDGLIFAFILDGKGGGCEVSWPEIASWKPQDGVLWVHINFESPDSQRWLADESGLGELVAEALLAEETRPRSVAINDGLLVILRGITHIPGPAPNEMVSIRMWMDSHRIVTARRWRLSATETIRTAVKKGHGPHTVADFLISISENMIESVGPAIDELEDLAQGLEDEIGKMNDHDLRARLGFIRREAIQMRRFMAPQRDALSQLITERAAWLGDADRSHLREIRDRTAREVDDLDASRQHAEIVRDEMASRERRQMNRIMYILALFTAMFLPLTFVTGLLGMNVDGIPFAKHPNAFLFTCVSLAGVSIMQWLLFRMLKLVR